VVPTDWAAVHQQLERCGALGFQHERLAQGTYRMSCLLPTAQPDRKHRIDVEAASETEAVRLMLAKANEWTMQQRGR
jgi:hypothetical protein